MKLLHKLNPYIIFLMLALYLLLPVRSLSHADMREAAVADAAVLSIVLSSDASPCGDCPCHQGENGSDCCDTGSHGCSCHTASLSNITDRYAPAIVPTGFTEPLWSILDVYLQIFVPPQNCA